jgi:phage-related protein (TIGR01555 family)
MPIRNAAKATLSKALEAGAALAGLAAVKLDGWQSTVTGVGLAASDKGVSYYLSRPPLLQPRQCSDLYHFDDLANVICSAVPEDATREGIEVVRQTEGGDGVGDIEVSQAQEESQAVEARLEALDALGVTREAMTWARTMGGAGVLGLFEGGGLPWEPLQEESITKVVALKCIDREDLTPASYYLSGPKAGETEVYYLNLVTQSGIQASNLRIHESRVIWFRGASTSRKERLTNGGWDHSVLQRIYPVLQQVNGAWGAVMSMMQDMSQAVIKLEGLIDAMGSDGGPEVMQARVNFMNLVRGITRMLVLDAGSKDSPGESFEVVERGSVTGAEALVDRLFTRLAAAGRMPVTRLMGQSPAGLNATGDADVRWWYDTIRVCQTLEVKPRYLRIVRWVCIELGFKTDGWDITFPPLWQMTPMEEATLRKSVADTDAIYIDKGVTLPEEITLSRWGNGYYSAETKVDLEVRKAALEASKETDGETEDTKDLGTVGAQTDAILKVVKEVIAKTIPRETGLGILVGRFAMAVEEANKLLGPPGFTPPPPELPPGTPPSGSQV